MKRLKKILSLTLIFALLLTSMPVGAFATTAGDTPLETPSEQYDTSWYDANPTASQYVLTTAAELEGLAELVDSGIDFHNVTIKLGNDINLSSKAWNPIGSYVSDSDNKPFKGVFDGQEYEISGLKASGNYSALFAYISGNVTIENLVMKDVDVSGKQYVAAVAARANAEAENITVENCYIDGVVKEPDSAYGNQYVAGLIAYLQADDGTATIRNCEMHCGVSGTSYAGSIVGSAKGNTYDVIQIENCHNYNPVTGGNNSEYCGGIAGYATNVKFTKCSNYGDVYGNSTSDDNGSLWHGGIAGYGSYMTFVDCANYGEIRAWVVGGLTAASSWGLVAKNCLNAGKLTHMSTPDGDGYALFSSGSYENCFYVSGRMRETSSEVERVTAEQLASGEICYRLNGSRLEDQFAWGQNLGSQAYPVLGGAPVYETESGYSNQNTYVATGTCGEHATWTLNKYGDLTITGEGSVEGDFSAYSTQIKRVSIQEGITSIGNHVFEGCSSLTSVVMAESVLTIGDCAFKDCTALLTLKSKSYQDESDRTVFNGHITAIGAEAFAGCTALKTVQFMGDAPTFGENCFADDVITLKYEGLNESWTDIAGSQFGGTITWNGYRANGSCGSQTDWNLSYDGVLTIYGNGKMSDYSTSPFLKYKKQIKEVVIEENVTRIGDGAFLGLANVTSITLPTSITEIGNQAFSGTAIKSFVIPETVSKLGTSLFQDCKSLESVVINAKLTEIPDSMYKGCLNIKEIDIPDTVQSIGEYAFSGTRITEIEIPESVTSIGNYAFSGCVNLETVSLDFTMTTLPTGLFMNCVSLKEFKMPDSITEIGASAFDNCAALDSIILPPNLTSIGNNAFDNTAISSIELPKSVTAIGSSAFKNCKKLKSIVLPDGLTKILYETFSGCASLTEIVIPANMDTIGSNAFSGCSKLHDITFLGNAPIFYSDVFQNVTANVYFPAGDYSWTLGKRDSFGGTLTWIPQGEGSVYDYHGDCSLSDNSDVHWGITPDGGLEIFGEGTMANYSTTEVPPWEKYKDRITSVKVAEGVDYIGKYAFYNLTTLTSASISSTVTQISAYTFYGCENLKTLNFAPSESELSINEYAFSGCKSLERVSFERRVWKIYTKTFENCISLKEMVFTGKAPSTFSTSAFTGCQFTAKFPAGDKSWSILKRVNYGGTVTWESYGDGIIYDGAGTFDSNITWTIIDGVLTITGEGDMKDCPYKNSNNVTVLDAPWEAYADYITSCVIEEGITSIGNYAFENCKNMRSIELPDSLTSIGQYAFSGCSSVESIVLPEGLTTIEFYGMRGLSGVKTLSLPASVNSVGNYALPYKLEKLTFEGSAPKTMNKNAFSSMTTTVYFPAGDPSWNFDTRLNYGGTLTWKPYGEGTVYGTSGTLGDNLTWSIMDGILTISGEGDMAVISSYSDVPWYDYRTYIEGCVMEDTVTSLSKYAFRGCNNMKYVDLSNAITSIEYGAFNGCSSLKEITIPASVTSFGTSIFYGCTGLETVIFEDGCMLVPSYLFSGCTGVKSVQLPNTISKIAGYAFEDCASLEHISIPAATTDFAMSAFDGCTALKSIDIDEGNTAYKTINGCVYNLSGTTLYAVPGGITSLVIPEGVKLIDNYAARYSTNLTEVIVPKSATKIGYQAFNGCTNLQSIMVLHKNCTFYNSTVIPDNEGLTIYGYEGSTAQTYAEGLTNATFVALTETTCPHPETYKADVASTAPTCTETGLTAGVKCSVCDHFFTPQEVITATGHTTVVDKAVAETCTTTGLTEGSHCSVCNEVLISQREIPAINHANKTKTIVPATVEMDGVIVVDCDDCDAVWTTPIYKPLILMPNTSFTYSGEDIYPSIAIVDSFGTAISDEYYDITYPEKSSDVGEYTIQIKFKDYYAGEFAKTYSITPEDITTLLDQTTLSESSFVYDGTYKNPEVNINDGALVEGMDYEVAYENNLNAGQATLNIKGIGNYTSTMSINFNIAKAEIDSHTFKLDYDKVVYDGTEKKPAVTCETLKAEDFEISYDKNVNAGEATVTINGIKNYQGTQTLTFTIEQKEITIDDFELTYAETTYDGVEKEPVILSGILKHGTDYTVVYENNIHAGDAKATVTGTGNYKGTVEFEFVIHSADITDSDVVVTLEYDAVPYDGTAKTPQYTIAGITGEYATAIAYDNNINIGIANAAITFTGDYTGTITKSFNIVEGEMKVSVDEYEGIYDGEAHSIAIKAPENAVVTYSETKNGEYTDVNPAYTSVGTYTVYYKVEKTNYKTIAGSAMVDITAQPLSDRMIVKNLADSYVYTGAVIKPDATIKGLIKGIDYTVTYGQNLNAGNGTITFTGIGNYTGKLTKTFAITAAEMKIAVDRYEGVYDGNSHTISVTVPANSEITYSTSENGDYTAEEPLFTNVGSYIVYYKVENPNYITVSGSSTVKITAQTLSEEMVVGNLNDSYVYTGSAIQPDATIQNLTKGTDYTVSYGENLNVGEGTITFTGTGNYTGFITKSFSITVANVNIAVNHYEGIYDGNGHTISVTAPANSVITYSTSENGDYTADEPLFTNVGLYTVYYKVENSNYKTVTGSATVTITPQPLSDEMVVEGLADSYVYTGALIKPNAAIKGLTRGSDYIVAYGQNLNVGDGTVTFTGTGNYTGSITKAFTITAAKMSITVDNYEGVYDGNSHTISVTAPANAVIKYATSKYGVYTEDVPLYTNVGTYTVYYNVSKTNYQTVSGSSTVKITAQPLSDEMIVEGLNDSYVYTGAAIQPDATIQNLTKGRDYTVSYGENLNVGEGSVTFTGIGNYSETITKTFRIMEGEMNVWVDGFEGIYDSKSHGITVTAPKNAVVSYAETEDGAYTTEKPVYTDAGTYTVYYKVEQENYTTVTGSAIVTISVKPLSEEMVVENLSESYVFTGSRILPDAGIQNLVKDRDYTVSYGENLNVGKGVITFVGTGNYDGTITKRFEITEAEMEVTAEGYEGTYDSNPHGIIVYAPDNAVVTYATDADEIYTAEIPTYTNVGTYTVHYKVAKPNYKTVTDSATVVITAQPLSEEMVVENLDSSYVYCGSAIFPNAGIQNLVKDKDYSISFGENLNAGKGMITFIGEGNYTGAFTKYFDIVPTTIEAYKEKATLDKYKYVYDGTAKCPTVTVEGLTVGTDYVVTYKDNTELGDAKAVITGTGNYNGSFEIPFSIVEPADIGELTAVLSKDVYTYDGTAHEPNVTIDGLTAGVDYLVSYDANVNAGEGKVIITGQYAYKGELIKTFKIEPKDIDADAFSLNYDYYTFSGSAVEPNVYGSNLWVNTDYTVSYNDNTDVGTGKAIIKGIGNYKGTVTKEFTIGYLSYYENYDDNYQTVRISDCYHGAAGEIVVPEKINGKPVTEIDRHAFSWIDNITGIQLPETITTIGSYAFESCYGLNHINIPGSVISIGSYAFDNCDELESIIIPEGVTTIGEYAFAYCDNLSSLIISPTVTNISDAAFTGSNNVALFCCKDSVAEAYCKDKGLDYALTDGTDEENTVSGLRGETVKWSLNKKTGELVIDTTGDMPSFANNEAPWKANGNFVTSVEINGSSTNIGEYAFNGCNNLVSVTMHNGIETIESSVFSGCNDLETVVVSDALKTIRSNAFNGCTSLKEMSLPNCTAKVDSRAFYNCVGLEKIDMPDEMESIGEYAFYNCISLDNVVLPNGLTYIGENAFTNCDSLSEIEIPEGIINIPYYAFANCDNLTKVKLPASLTSIGSYAFGNCNLTEVEIPYQVTNVSYDAFADNANLTKIVFRNINCTISDSFKLASTTVIYGFKDSTAEIFAKKHGFDFVAMDEGHEHSWVVILQPAGAYYNNGYIRTTCSGCGSYTTETIYGAYPSLSSTTLSYTGEDIQPKVTVNDNQGHPISEEYYEIVYPEKSSEIGTYEVTVNFKGNYSGTWTCSYSVVERWLPYDKITLESTTVSYDGTAKEPKVTIEGLIEGVDFKVTYSNNTKPGGAYCTITGMGTYKGSYELEFQIVHEKHEWNEGEVISKPNCTEEGRIKYTCIICDETEYQYIDSLGHTIKELEAKKATCTDDGLTKGRMCTVCGTVIEKQITIKSSGHNYGSDHICDKCGNINESLKPVPEPAPTPTPTPTPDNDTDDEESADEHECDFVDVLTPATKKADGSIVSKCACGEIDSVDTIKKIATIKLNKDAYVYNGKIRKPSVIIKDSKGNKIDSEFYTIKTPKGRKQIGTYVYKITFKGEYAGSASVKLTIKPVKPTVKVPAAAKKTITVKWKKGKKAQVTGYQVMVATNAKFTKNVKTTTIKGYTKTSGKVTKLKAKKKYFVKVRTYKTVKGVKVYSDWSKAKTCKTK